MFMQVFTTMHINGICDLDSYITGQTLSYTKIHGNIRMFKCKYVYVLIYIYTYIHTHISKKDLDQRICPLRTLNFVYTEWFIDYTQILKHMA